MDVAILAHGHFPDRAKTAVGLLRYGDDDVVAVLDRDRAGERVTDHLPDVPDAPIVESATDAPAFDALVIGIAPIGGGFDERWRADVRATLRAGSDVVAGLHTFLADDEEFRALAAAHGGELRDLRRPPADLEVATGRGREIDAEVVLTVGTDCSTGKMTTAIELVRQLREDGVDAGFVPTGQTGMLLGDGGIAVDRVPADFLAGAVEQMIVDRAGRDILIVEGQGAITHPAYSAVTCGILHGAMPDHLVLCHRAGRTHHHGYDDFPLPPASAYVDLYETVADPVTATDIVGGALNTAGLDDGAARDAVARFARSIDAPATDPHRDGVDDLVAAIR